MITSKTVCNVASIPITLKATMVIYDMKFNFMNFKWIARKKINKMKKFRRMRKKS